MNNSQQVVLRQYYNNNNKKMEYKYLVIDASLWIAHLTTGAFFQFVYPNNYDF